MKRGFLRIHNISSTKCETQLAKNRLQYELQIRYTYHFTWLPFAYALHINMANIRQCMYSCILNFIFLTETQHLCCHPSTKPWKESSQLEIKNLQSYWIDRLLQAAQWIYEMPPAFIQHNYNYNLEILQKKQKNKWSGDLKKKEKNLKDANNSSMIKLLLGATESSAYVLNSYQVTLKSWLHWLIYSLLFFFFLAKVSFFLKGFRDLQRSFVW